MSPFDSQLFLTIKINNMKVSKSLDSFSQRAEILVDEEISAVKGGSNNIAIVFPVVEEPIGWWDETEG